MNHSPNKKSVAAGRHLKSTLPEAKKPKRTARAEQRSDEITEITESNVRTIFKCEEEEKEKRTPMDRAVDAITAFCGSMAFVWVHAVWFGTWMGYNLFAGSRGFDPYPFQLLTLVVSLEAIFLSTFILISQNREAVIAERRSHLDLQVNLLAEQENTKTFQILMRIAEKVGASEVGQDEEAVALSKNTKPEELMKEIEEAHKKKTKS